MADTPHDNWNAGDAYERYMGRWSRHAADRFLAWLRPPRAASWLEVGCGTGALTAAICESCDPAAVVASDASPAFVAFASRRCPSPRASFVVADAASPPGERASFDVAVSGLVLNFLPDPERALRALGERLRPGGAAAAYVWDYGGGVELLSAFWAEAVRQRPAAAAMDESRRFAGFDAKRLSALFRAAGLSDVAAEPLSVATRFADFDDYWSPFLAGTGPAPSYVATLAPALRDDLRARLRRRLPAGENGTIPLSASLLAVRGTAP